LPMKRVSIALAAVLVSTSGVGMTLEAVPAAAAPVHPVMNTGEYPPDGVYFRNSPQWNDTSRISGWGVYAGNRVQLRCWGTGTDVPRRDGGRNTLWYRALNVTRPGAPGGRENSGWINAHFVNDGTGPGQVVSGVPRCGGVTTATAPQPASKPAEAPLVWAGSPVESQWDGGEPASPPSVHHWLANARDQGDWAVDLPTASGQKVVLYVAPEARGTAVTTKVDQIGAACANGRNGGSFDTVGIYSGSLRAGSITYAHINPSVRLGQTLNRWGSVVGTVGSGYPRNSACWTGPHVHLQMYSTKRYSCYNKGYTHNYPVHRTNFVGFTGGNKASAPRRACP